MWDLNRGRADCERQGSHEERERKRERGREGGREVGRREKRARSKVIHQPSNTHTQTHTWPPQCDRVNLWNLRHTQRLKERALTEMGVTR
jgi:hypothetical protein